MTMTPEQHIAEAEELAATGRSYAMNSAEWSQNLAAVAQVHIELAKFKLNAAPVANVPSEDERS